MWPAVFGPLYYAGIGIHALLAVLLGQRFRLRAFVPLAIAGCYLFAMTVGAKALFDVSAGSFSLAALLRREHYLFGGMFAGPVLYLVLVAPLALVLSRWAGRGREEDGGKGSHSGKTGRMPGVQRSEKGFSHQREKGFSHEWDARSAKAGKMLAPQRCEKGFSHQRSKAGKMPAPPRSEKGFSHQRPWAALDLVALTLPIPMAICKLACLCAGCCYGKVSNLPWAITFPWGNPLVRGGVPLHPTQVYDVLVLLGAAALLAWVNRPRWHGTLLFWLAAFCGLGRLFTDFFRQHLPGQVYWGPLTPFQWTCAAAGGVCIVILVRSKASAVSVIPRSDAKGTEAATLT